MRQAGSVLSTVELIDNNKGPVLVELIILRERQTGKHSVHQ